MQLVYQNDSKIHEKFQLLANETCYVDSAEYIILKF